MHARLQMEARPYADGRHLVSQGFHNRPKDFHTLAIRSGRDSDVQCLAHAQDVPAFDRRRRRYGHETTVTIENGKEQLGFTLPRRGPHRSHQRQFIQDDGVVLDKDAIGKCFFRRKNFNFHTQLPQGQAIGFMLSKRQMQIDFSTRRVPDFTIDERKRGPAGEGDHGFSPFVVCGGEPTTLGNSVTLAMMVQENN